MEKSVITEFFVTFVNTMEEVRINLLGMTLEQLRSLAVANGLKSFVGNQIARWIYVNRVKTIDEMTSLSVKARAMLSEHYQVGRSEPLRVARSTDGTVKYLFEGAGSRDIETVMIPDRDRATLCVSSQAGCKMNCRFCMTGRQGFHGNLSVAQIINQVLSVENSADLTNIVFMGMGEPTDNLDAVMQAIEVLTAPWGLAWSPKRITVSTIGNIPALRRLCQQSRVHIAVSVHAPYAAERQSIMPVERAWPISEVMALLTEFDWAHQRRLSVEYIVFKGLNDSPRHAMALARLIKGTDARVNLIRFHHVDGVDDLDGVSQRHMEDFRDRLNELGVTATIRASRGEDIDAACGQLAGKGHKINPSYSPVNNLSIKQL